MSRIRNMKFRLQAEKNRQKPSAKKHWWYENNGILPAIARYIESVIIL
ncbi:MAG: hypothetical protein GKR87_01905 [Kiritimatiellae bacterium]|nr:hypothetical protein [Kiritimatiellia bacterium]